MTEETPKAESPQPPRRRKGVRILLFVSLALNLVIIGVVGGAILNFSRGEDHPRMVSRELGLGPYLMALEPDQRKMLDEAAYSQKQQLRDGRVKWRKSYQETLSAIRAEPFDPERLRAAMAEQAELATRSREVGLDIMVRQIEMMPAAERAAFADRLESRSNKWKKRDGKDGRRPADSSQHPPRN